MSDSETLMITLGRRPGLTLRMNPSVTIYVEVPMPVDAEGLTEPELHASLIQAASQALRAGAEQLERSAASPIGQPSP